MLAALVSKRGRGSADGMHIVSHLGTSALQCTLRLIASLRTQPINFIVCNTPTTSPSVKSMSMPSPFLESGRSVLASIGIGDTKGLVVLGFDEITIPAAKAAGGKAM